MGNVIYKDNNNYPKLLKQIGKDAPKQLYYKVRFENLTRHSLDEYTLPPSERKGCSSQGNACPSSNRTSENVAHKAMSAHLFDNCLAVVGSRKLTHYGQQAIERIVGQVASAGITIVSGFMYGGDAVAHKTAVEVGGRTIAVMPCGIDRISPEDQEDLYNEIIENNGMIISEYEGDMAPALWTYPRRNRIVAGLSKAVLVIEAGEKSGSLITANLAKKFKRKIFALPGPITSSVSFGTNALIKQGAEMVTEASDILKWFRVRSEKDKKARPYSHNLASQGCSSVRHVPVYLSKARPIPVSIEKHILKCLEREPFGIDELSRDLEISVSELSVKLSMMEMQGMIESKQGKYYNRK